MRGAGLVRLGLVATATAGVVTAATLVDLPEVQLAGAAPATSAVAGSARLDRSVLACPGPESIGVKGVEPVGTPPAPAQVSAAAPPATLLGLPAGGPERGQITADRLPGSRLADATGAATDTAYVQASTVEPAAVALTGSAAWAAGLVGAQWTTVDSGDLRGVWSSACRAGADDAWLVGGGTGPGRRGRIVLANAAPNAVDVEVEVLGADGPVARSAGSTVVVPARSRVVLLLDALAPGVRSPVVHVRSTGGTVSATLLDSLLDGTTPRGVDAVEPAAPASRRTLVPGVSIRDAALLRVAVPGGSEAVAQVRLLGVDGPVDLPGEGVVRVRARSSVDLDLAQVPDGAYTIEVTSDVPVVAGASVTRVGPAATDLAWLASTPLAHSLAGAAGVPSGSGWTSQLVVSAPDRAVQVEWLVAGAQQRLDRATVDVPAGSTRVLDLPAGYSVWVRQPQGQGDGIVAARLSSRAAEGGGMLTGGPLAVTARTVSRPAVAPAP